MVGTFAPAALAAGPLSITNVDNPDPVQSGSQILYTVVVTNTGGAKVNNVVLTDQINGVVGFGNPPLLDVVSTRGSCSQTNTQVTCSAGSIEGFGSWTVTIRGIVTAAAGTTINNIATVVATKSAQTYTTSAAATTQVQGSGPGGPSPDLTIGKNGPLQVTPGIGITYTLTVNNLGNGNALGVKVTDTVPAAITLGAVTATSLFTCSTSGQTVTCINGRVNAGSNATITINGTIAAAAAGDLENTSVVDPDNTIDEGELGNTADAAELNNFSNTVVTHVSPVPPEPTNVIFFDKQGPATAIPGQTVQYTLTMTNGAVGRADYITMTDGTQGLHAASLRVVSAESDSGTDPVCTVAAPTVECTMTRLAINDTFVVVIEGMVVASAGSTIINSAAVNANVKNNGYTERDEVQTIINAGRDLTISKSDLPDPVCARSWPDMPVDLTECKGGLTYTFIVGNSGVQNANSVLVRDPLPPGTTYDDALTDAANLLLGDGDVTCNEVPVRVIECVIPVLEANSSQTIKIILVAPPTLGSITNTVTVDPSNSVFESDETNNIAVETTTVATGIDLTIRKDDSPPNSPNGFDPIATSGTQTYRIVVDNTGTQNVTGIHVRDILPAGTIFLTAEEIDLNGTGTFPDLHGFTCAHDGAPTGGNVDCTGGSLLGTADEFYFPPQPGDDKAYIEIKVFARPTVGLMHNEVRVDPLNQIAEYDETDNIEFEDTTVINGDAGVGAFNELSITKSSAPQSSVATSTPVTYTIRVTNTGTDPAVNVLVRDTLPVGFVLISAFDAAPLDPLAFLCAPAPGNVVDCNGATINGLGGFREITIVAFSSAVPGPYTNQAIVDPTNAIPEGNETNNAAQDQITVEVGTPILYIDLTITKDDGVTTHAAPDGLVSYDLTVTNLGTQPAFGVTVRDSLPAGTTFVSAADTTAGSPPGQFLCSIEGGGVVSCVAGTVDGSPGLIASIPNVRTITVVVRAPLANATIINQAAVDPANTIPEGDETNNTAFDTTPVQSNIDLELDKTGPGEASQGTTTNYEITVKNLGTQDATHVVMRDPLPVGVIPLNVTVDDADWTCEISQNPVNLVECEGTLQNATTDPDGVLINIEVFVTLLNGTLDNEACVDPDDEILEFSADTDFNPDGNGNNCKTKVTVVVPPAPDMQIFKDAPGSVSPGGDLVYTLTAMNVGTGDAPGATVTDDLPTDVTFVSANATNGWNCSEAAGTVTCTSPGTVAPGDLTIITIETTVSTGATTAIENTASVAATGDTNLSNDESTVTTSVGGEGIDLVLVSISDAPDPVPYGDALTYTIVVTNAGAVQAEDVLVRSVLSNITNIELASATASQGFACTPASAPISATIECTGDLLPGQSTVITIVIQVNAGAPSPLQLDVTVDPDLEIDEASELNNSGTEVTTLTGDICPLSTTCVDLIMSGMLESNDPIDVGDTVTYTITVGNIGNSTTDTGAGDQVLIFFNIFGDVSNWSYTATNGFTCTSFTSAGQVLADCTGDLDAGVGTIVQITVTADTAGTLIDAIAFADPEPFPPPYVGPGTIAEFSESNNGPAARTTTVNP